MNNIRTYGYMDPMPPAYNTSVSGYSLITLALGVLGQTVVATFCLLSAVLICTWSSSPIRHSCRMRFSQLSQARSKEAYDVCSHLKKADIGFP
jgi:hypothetical protein